TSRNVRGNWLTDLALGGLNYQIEHHLFPSMPRPNLRRSKAIVAAFCRQQGVPYTETSLVRSYVLAVRHLHEAGRPAPRPPPRPARSSAGPGPALTPSLDRADLLRLRPLRASAGGEVHPLVLLEGAEPVHLDCGVVHEDVSRAVVRGDEAVPLVGVEPLHGALSHERSLLLRRSSESRKPSTTGGGLCARRVGSATESTRRPARPRRRRRPGWTART